jgi:hypothetical protein
MLLGFNGMMIGNPAPTLVSNKKGALYQVRQTFWFCNYQDRRTGNFVTSNHGNTSLKKWCIGLRNTFVRSNVNKILLCKFKSLLVDKTLLIRFLTLSKLACHDFKSMPSSKKHFF